MDRQAIEREMDEVLGRRLLVFDRVPDEFLADEWHLLKRLVFGQTLIPSKYKHLIGLAVAAASRSPTGVALHTALARLHAASEAEIAEAVQYSKLVVGWGLYVTGLGLDERALEDEVARLAAFLAERGGGCVEGWPFPHPAEEDGAPSAHEGDNREGR